MDLMIGGYREGRAGSLVLTSGKSREVHEEQLKYNILTEQGLSGSPIFMAYNGVETVIGIQ